MDTDFKLNFLSNQSQKPDVNAGTVLKTKEVSNGKSFEDTLNSKRDSARSERNGDNVGRKGEDDRRARDRSGRDSVEGRRGDRNTDDNKTEASREQRGNKGDKRVDNAGRRDNEAAKTDDAGKDVPDEVIAEMMSKIAGVLGVTPEQVAGAMEKLNLSPGQLCEPENVTKLIMEVKGLSDPAELLKMSGLAELQKEITDVMQRAMAGEAEMSAVNAGASAADGAGGLLETDAALAGNAAEQMNVETEDGTGDNKTGKSAGGTTFSQNASEEAKKLESKRILAANARNAEENGGRNSNGGSHGEAHMGGAARSGEILPGAAANELNSIEAANADSTEQTPIVVQKGGEVVVEIGGRIVSRAVQRPQIMPEDVTNQIIDKMKLDFKPGTTELKISLRPHDLGNVTVKIVTEGGHVTAEIVTENSKVKELVEENISVLRDSLRQQGVDVGELSVSVGQQEQQDNERMKQFFGARVKSHARMSRIISRIAGEEMEAEAAGYANESEIHGNTVNYSA